MKKALQQAYTTSLESMQHIDLCGQHLDRMDAASLAPLKSCRTLSLSTNCIDRITGLNMLPSLEILSIGRNCVKRLEGIEAAASTLHELWMSYNLVEKLAGVEKCTKLRVLYASNNKIKDWSEIDRLATLPSLEDVLLTGNPLCNEAGYRLEVIRRMPGLKKLDGALITPEERLEVADKVK